MLETLDFHGHRGRLRDRLLKDGARSMPDYELLELLLTFAIPRRDVKPLAKRLLARFGSFKKVLDAPLNDLSGVEGVGAATAAYMRAVRSSVERYMETSARESDALTSPEAVIAYCRASLDGLKHEVFDVIYLNTRNRVLTRDRISEGTVNETAVYPRRVVQGALAHHAAAIIIVHNHPSGDPSPSLEDKALTRRLVAAAGLVDIPVLDHIIVGDGRHFSFREAGLLPDAAR
jgi:DNA repair protein RadC